MPLKNRRGRLGSSGPFSFYGATEVLPPRLTGLFWCHELRNCHTNPCYYSSEGIVFWGHTGMSWEVEYTDELGDWWESLSEGEQESIDASVRLLEARGPQLGFPHSSGISTSRHPHMRELLIQHQGRPYRILYAFDPSRNAILLIGGDKTGQDRWYDQFVPLADDLYDEHVVTLEKEANDG